MHYLLVATGGALGALARYMLYNLAQRLEHHAALVTLTINAIGAFIIGIMFVLLSERAVLDSHYQSLLSVGFLGAFTTYSTYSLDALRLFEQGRPGTALLYLVGTMVLCLLAVWLGATLMRSA
jgi:CrcB protein